MEKAKKKYESQGYDILLLLKRLDPRKLCHPYMRGKKTDKPKRKERKKGRKEGNNHSK